MGLGVGVSGFVFRVYSLRIRALGFLFRVSDVGLRLSGFMFRVSLFFLRSSMLISSRFSSRAWYVVFWVSGFVTQNSNQEGRHKATWKRKFKVPWREAGPLNHLDDKW